MIFRCFPLLFTYYIRDPQGNVLAVYERAISEEQGEADVLSLKERHLYAAKRLGIVTIKLADDKTESLITQYELTNHIGNVLTVITDEDNGSSNDPKVESLTDYYPFGMEEPGRSYNSNTSRFGYTGHEKENDLAEGVYTTQYRLLDTRLGRWMSVDPLFAKYPDMSAYNYCGGNPVLLVDKNGDKLFFAEGCSNEFKEAFRQAVLYLKENGVDYAFARLEASDENFYISEFPADTPLDVAQKTGYNTQSHTIFWTPKYGAIYDNGNVASPAAILNHEAAHAARHARYLMKAKKAWKDAYVRVVNLYLHHDLNAANEKKREGETTEQAIYRMAKEAGKAAYKAVIAEYNRYRDYEQNIPAYQSLEEKQNIMFDEQETAHKTGEVPMDEVTRTSHSEMKFIEVESVRSTPDNSTITPQ